MEIMDKLFSLGLVQLQLTISYCYYYYITFIIVIFFFF